MFQLKAFLTIFIVVLSVYKGFSAPVKNQQTGPKKGLNRQTSIDKKTTFKDLPPDVLGTIASKMSVEQTLRFISTRKEYRENANELIFQAMMNDKTFNPWENMKHYKIAAKHPKYKEYLLEQPSSAEKLVKAAGNGQVDLVDHAIQKGINPGFNRNQAIISASEMNRLAVVNRLLQEKSVDPSDRRSWALCTASKNGHVKIVDSLLKDKRALPHHGTNHAILWASQFGRLNVVNRLLEDERVDPTVPDNLAIITAKKNGHQKVVERLLADQRVKNSYNP